MITGVALATGWGLAGWLAWKSAHPPQPAATSPPASTPIAGISPVPPPAAPRETDPGGEPSPLQAIFERWSATPALAGAAIGFCLLDEDGQVAYASPLAATALCPASALKTLTTGAALDLLGPDFRFETVLAATRPPAADGTLEGDLMLIGDGDPTLAGEDLAALAREVAKAGVKKVRGSLRVDASIFPDPPVSDHWVWGDLGNAYGTGAYGVNLDHNRMTLSFDPGTAPGAPATLRGSTPAFGELRWRNRVTTGEAGTGDRVTVYAEPYGRTVTLYGTVPAGEPGFEVGAALPDPPAFVAQRLKAELEKAGVSFVNRPASGTAESSRRVALASHRSVALPEIIDHLHRVSDNLEAQCLFLAIGRNRREDPVRAIRRHWEEAGVAFTGLRMIDGSGLARANMIRPLDLAAVNHAMRKGRNGARFYESLNLSANGAARAKLGAMSGVKTEVGFLRLENGRELTYAVMANGLPLDLDFWALKGRLLEQVRTGAR